MYVISCMDYHVFMKLAIPGYFVSLSPVRTGTLGGRFLQWIKEVDFSGAPILSALRICKAGGNPVFGLHGQQTEAETKQHSKSVPGPGYGASHCGAGGNEQSEHCHYNPGHCGDPGICIQSQICAVPLDGGGSGGIYRNLF